MKTYEQLMKHYWGVIVPMAEAAGINPWECVRHVNEDEFTDHPKFEGKPWNYTFALTVLEGKGVFVGDKIYSKKDNESWVISECDKDLFVASRWTWTPPTKKRTFIVNSHYLTNRNEIVIFTSPIEIDGLPEGWDIESIVIAPRNSNDDPMTALAEVKLRKTEPRRIVLEETEKDNVKSEQKGEYWRGQSFSNNIGIRGARKIWREINVQDDYSGEE